MTLKLLLSTILILLYISPPSTVAQCPYSCGNTPPATTMPPPATTMPPPATTLPPPSQSGNYHPPAAIYTPPSNVFSHNPSTPTFYGGAPPPPDPIVPWFPFYYKDPPRNPRKSSSAEVRSWSTAVVFLVHLVLFRLLFC